MVVNFATESHVDRSIESPETFLDTNIKGTAVLMDACIKYQVGRFHQISTDEVYGDLPLDRPELLFTEETPLCTSSSYSSSKAAADFPTTLRRLSMDTRLVARKTIRKLGFDYPRMQEWRFEDQGLAGSESPGIITL